MPSNVIHAATRFGPPLVPSAETLARRAVVRRARQTMLPRQDPHALDGANDLGPHFP